MSKGVVFKFQNKEEFLSKFSDGTIQNSVKKGVRKNIPIMQKIMYDATPESSEYNHKHREQGNLRKAWIRSVDGKPTKRVTGTKNGDVNVFLYNHAKDSNGYEYCNFANNGHASYNQFGGPYPTKYGTGWIPGLFFIERGADRIKDSTELTDSIEKAIVKELNKK